MALVELVENDQLHQTHDFHVFDAIRSVPATMSCPPPKQPPLSSK